MAEHTPTPWNAASSYSSVVGVPIVGSQGQHIGNTALPGMPAEWAEMKERAVANATFIVRAVNAHDALVKALAEALAVIEDTVGYEHSGDPWEENAFEMGELDIHDYARDGRLEKARALLAHSRQEHQ